MKLNIILTFFALSSLSCTQDKTPIAGDTEFQREINSEYKDATTSPLKDKDRKNFKGLEFFEFDSTYCCERKFKANAKF